MSTAATPAISDLTEQGAPPSCPFIDDSWEKFEDEYNLSHGEVHLLESVARADLEVQFSSGIMKRVVKLVKEEDEVYAKVKSFKDLELYYGLGPKMTQLLKEYAWTSPEPERRNTAELDFINNRAVEGGMLPGHFRTTIRDGCIYRPSFQFCRLAQLLGLADKLAAEEAASEEKRHGMHTLQTGLEHISLRIPKYDIPEPTPDPLFVDDIKRVMDECEKKQCPEIWETEYCGHEFGWSLEEDESLDT